MPVNAQMMIVVLTNGHSGLSSSGSVLDGIVKDSGRIKPADSGSDHRKNHLEPRNRSEGMWLACWHENDFAAMQAIGLSGNHNFCFAFHATVLKVHANKKHRNA